MVTQSSAFFDYGNFRYEDFCVTVVNALTSFLTYNIT